MTVGNVLERPDPGTCWTVDNHKLQICREPGQYNNWITASWLSVYLHMKHLAYNKGIIGICI